MSLTAFQTHLNITQLTLPCYWCSNYWSGWWMGTL